MRLGVAKDVDYVHPALDEVDDDIRGVELKLSLRDALELDPVKEVQEPFAVVATDIVKQPRNQGVICFVAHRASLPDLGLIRNTPAARSRSTAWSSGPITHGTYWSPWLR